MQADTPEIEELGASGHHQPGVGVVTAAQLIICWSHAGRILSKAAFAARAGVAPIPTSSGNTVRHRRSAAARALLPTSAQPGWAAVGLVGVHDQDQIPARRTATSTPRSPPTPR